MARLTLFALLVLALIQVALALPFGRKKITNAAARGVLKGGYRGTTPTVERDVVEGPFTEWDIQPFEGGASIFMPQAESFLQTDGSAVFLGTTQQLWYPTNDYFNGYRLTTPDETFALEWNEYTRKVSLQPSNGKPSQLWHIPSSYSYSRMYCQ